MAVHRAGASPRSIPDARHSSPEPLVGENGAPRSHGAIEGLSYVALEWPQESQAVLGVVLNSERGADPSEEGSGL